MLKLIFTLVFTICAMSCHSERFIDNISINEHGLYFDGALINSNIKKTSTYIYYTEGESNSNSSFILNRESLLGSSSEQCTIPVSMHDKTMSIGDIYCMDSVVSVVDGRAFIILYGYDMHGNKLSDFDDIPPRGKKSIGVIKDNKTVFENVQLKSLNQSDEVRTMNCYIDGEEFSSMNINKISCVE